MICVKLFSDMLNYWLVVLTIVKTFESFVHIFVHIVLIKLLVIRMKLMKSCNLLGQLQSVQITALTVLRTVT